jgi:hypothetical protein
MPIMSSILAQQLSAMSQPAAIARRRVRARAGQRLHVEIVGQQQAVEADAPADDLVDHEARLRGGIDRIPGGVADVRGHRHRGVGQRAERGDIGFQFGLARRNRRQRLVAVGVGAAVAGHVLDDPATPAAASPSRIARPSAATRSGSLPSARSPITSWAPGWRTSSSGRQSTVMPDFGQIEAERLGIGRAASIALAGAMSYSRSNTSPGGNASHSGAFIRATRPPS